MGLLNQGGGLLLNHVEGGGATTASKLIYQGVYFGCSKVEEDCKRTTLVKG